MISLSVMTVLISLWFARIWLIAFFGVPTPVIPLNLLVIAFLGAAITGQKIHRRLT